MTNADQPAFEKPTCIVCMKTCDELEEYIVIAEEEGMTPEEYVKDQEGTYNPFNRHFYCTDCYCKIGMPLGIAP